MLVKGALIQCDGTGQSKPVEDLRIGDRIFDPLASSDVEIVEILCRSLRFTERDRSLHAALLPLRVGPDALGPDMPQEAVHVSTGQTVFSVARSIRLNRFEQRSAWDLAQKSPDIQTCVMHEIDYIALFTELPPIMNVNGLLVQSYSYDALHLGEEQLGAPVQRGSHALRNVI